MGEEVFFPRDFDQTIMENSSCRGVRRTFLAGRLTDKDLSGKLSFLIAPLRSSGVSISTDGRRNTSATLLIEVGYFFLERRSN